MSTGASTERILEAWDAVCSQLRTMAVNHDEVTDSRALIGLSERHNVIDSVTAFMLRELNDLRDLAAHVSDKLTLPPEEVDRFRHFTDDILQHLRREGRPSP